MSLRKLTRNLRVEASGLSLTAADRQKVVSASPKMNKLLDQIVRLFQAAPIDNRRSMSAAGVINNLLLWDVFEDSGFYATFSTEGGRLSVNISVGGSDPRPIGLVGTNVTPEQARAYAETVKAAAKFQEEVSELLVAWTAEFKKTFPKS